MVHPNVLKNGGIDSNKYTGFAFGWGVERIAAIKYGITDLRQLWRPKLDYLEQF
jgi:phenylalanyl-tRNA synthetase alpha chain